MTPPDDRRYSETHEWHKLDGDTLTLGLTKFAVDELTDITYVEMKPVGTTFEPGAVVGEVESVKTTSDVYCAVGGEIVEVNTQLEEDPSLLNSDPYGQGWLIRVKVADPAPYESLMTAAEYAQRYSG
ncbi:MAG: glycine cleavage system protein GcvH [Planctomycetota bacterium]|nr:MAG: glycine cleavage system protein GcvH [Planctomycetota bacterium]